MKSYFFNARSKADGSQLDLPHSTGNKRYYRKLKNKQARTRVTPRRDIPQAAEATEQPPPSIQ